MLGYARHLPGGRVIITVVEAQRAEEVAVCASADKLCLQGRWTTTP